MKQHKLRIELLGDYYCFYSKGHHDFETFKAAVAADQGCLPEEVNEPRHEWWRCNPSRDPEYSWEQADGTPGKRGSFPVTVCNCD